MTDFFELLSAETYEDYLKLVNVEVHQNISMCQSIAKDYQVLRLKMEKEKHEAQIKLHESAKQYYDRRREIICGNPLKPEEVVGYTPNTECPPNESSQYKSGVPCFWLHVLKNSEIFEDLQGNDDDSIILTYLQDISVDYFSATDDTLKDGTPTLKYTYQLNFLFKENPYLLSPTCSLKISYKLGDVDGEEEEPTVETLKAPEWVKGKDPRYKVIKKRVPKKGKTPSHAKTESFFDIFYTTQMALSNDINDDGDVDDEVLTLHDIFRDLMLLVTEVVPAAVNYFDELLIGDDDDMDEEDDETFDKQMKETTDGKPNNDDSNQPAPQECTHQ
ncbi:nucleosome assembly protein, putative [Entamoeba invadens IP1]|uniref:Nucleosome assembly protein, putative n=1 Tax=Entamoeba invadens IP1 TaxID=370355 RepID=A0A0A1U1A4_ENTIV|nr:nucleosome assembly protein, putative [Entamoeba invadens IP1]ELP87810.1 nucleosome assembly protein, putative [Entamoeba invadens IP1]|eukprot:XP_004254581.1 nucleosome assembly protein, putative [Entamoeba invadens IP1]